MARPTKYKKEYCDLVPELMADGMSVTEVAAHIGVSKSTVYKWAEDRPAFSDALKEGMERCEAWWESQGRRNLHVKEFNHVLWYMNMKNRFGWRDKQEVEHGGKDGGAIILQISQDESKL